MSDRLYIFVATKATEHCFRANDVRIYILPHVFYCNTCVSCLFVSLITDAIFWA